MTFAVYRSNRIKPGCAPEDEVMVKGGFASAGAAMDHANELQRQDRSHSYMVGQE